MSFIFEWIKFMTCWEEKLSLDALQKVKVNFKKRKIESRHVVNEKAARQRLHSADMHRTEGCCYVEVLSMY